MGTPRPVAACPRIHLTVLVGLLFNAAPAMAVQDATPGVASPIPAIGDADFISRSEPVPQTRTSTDVVEEFHALLEAAGIPGPYVLAGHSMGGFYARLNAATYPDDVAGMGTHMVVPIPGYGDLETLPWGGDNAVVWSPATWYDLRSCCTD